MFGAILGDIIGSPYEFDRGNKSKDFPLFVEESHFTDDSVMTLAVAEALLQLDTLQEQAVKRSLVACMQKWGHRYPDAGYGGRFNGWLLAENPQPYHSWGNGSAMRVSAVGWLYDSLETTRQVARWTAEVTHNHPEGIKGAESTAAAIWLVRNGRSKEELRAYIEAEFGYDLSRSCDEIRPGYHMDVSCQGSVPPAMIAFLEGRDFEDVIRNAVSLGGDTDTVAAIAGSIAEACYGVPRLLYEVVMNTLPEDLKGILTLYSSRAEADGRALRFENPLKTNWRMEEAIAPFIADASDENFSAMLYSIVNRMSMEGELFLPVQFLDPPVSEEEGADLSPGDEGILNQDVRVQYLVIQPGDGNIWAPAFTSLAEAEKGDPSSLVTERIVDILERALKSETLSGVILNPWGEGVLLKRALLEVLLEVGRRLPPEAATEVPGVAGNSC